MEARQQIEVLGVVIGAVEQVWNDRSKNYRYHARSRFSPIHRSNWTDFGAAKSQLIILAVQHGAFQNLATLGLAALHSDSPCDVGATAGLRSAAN